MTLAEADAKVPLNDPITIVINENTVDRIATNPDYYSDHVAYGGQVTTLSGEVIPADRTSGGDHNLTALRVTGVVYDLYAEERLLVDPAFTTLPNVKEIWLGPNCDIQGFLDALPAGRRSIFDNDRNTFLTYDRIVLIPASLYPDGPTYLLGTPACRVMLYDGDVYEAAKKGVSAARDWCTDHVYTAAFATQDRDFAGVTCTELPKSYYSCAKCGKIEYDPNHYWDSNAGTIDEGKTTAHDYSAHILTDEHFVGINANGDRVYLPACKYCGKDLRYHQINMTIEELIRDTGPATQAEYEFVINRYKQWWAEGGSSYDKAMRASIGEANFDCYTVATATYVTAATSDWAREDVNTASVKGLIDRDLLGDDYTATVTRLQFVSVAVKMAEKMLGTSITPAPSGTFTDTDNEYVRKAYAAGITVGNGDGTFDPNGTLTRQQMATFLYRALQYVKDNSDTRYSIYDSQLGNYSDASQLESWAVDPMAFMNAFGLIKGTSDTTLSPEEPCAIEQAVVVALRSLDAGKLGWYQNIGNEGSYGGGPRHLYGDRIWVTSIYTTGFGNTLTLL